MLVLYTGNAMSDSNTLSGAERSNSQMETDIALSYQGANDALAASGVDFSIRVVHMREVRFTGWPSIKLLSVWTTSRRHTLGHSTQEAGRNTCRAG